MSSDLHGRLLSEIERVRLEIRNQSIILDRLDIAVVLLFQELRRIPADVAAKAQRLVRQ